MVPLPQDIRSNVREEIKKKQYKVDIAPFDLIDLGQCRVNDQTHQLLIQQKGAFVLLLDGRKDLDEPLPLENLLHWVNSILIYCETSEDDIYPLILFAATHSDELSEQEQHKQSQKIIKQLSEMFSTNENCKRIKYQHLFFINATDREDIGVKDLQQFLVDVAFKQKSWGEKMPMAWVPLELQMDELRSKDVFVISYDILDSLNRSNKDLALSDKQLKHFLKVQHSLGRLMYYDLERLNEFIIVLPTAMVYILVAFITEERFWPSDFTINAILSDASKSGIIKKKDLMELWTQEELNKYVPTSRLREFMAHVLVHLDILVEPRRPSKLTVDCEQFIVPCMIKQCLPTKYVPNNLEDDQTIFLSYRLFNPSVPKAFAYKLIGAVLNIWPLKKIDEQVCIYDKAAVLEIDQLNFLSISFENNRVVVALSNTRSKNYISPDIASIIQKCMTLTVSKVLEFYTTSFGWSAIGQDVSTFFVIEIGWKCGTQICFAPLNDVKERKSWTCANKTDHSTMFPLYWAFDQRQEMCGLECTGKYTDCLHDVPEDKHLIRLAKRVYDRFEEIVIHLGIPRAEWNDIKKEYSKPLTRRFIALCRCRDGGRTFRDFAKALQDIDYSNHFLCQVFIDGCKEVLDEATIRHQETPDDDNLKELSEKIGDVALPLGVELGLSLPVIERICFKNKDIFRTNYDILKEWKRKGEYTTILFLMKALYHADKRGYNFLRDTYKMLK